MAGWTCTVSRKWATIFIAIFYAIPGKFNGLLFRMAEVIHPLITGKTSTQENIHHLFFGSAE